VVIDTAALARPMRNPLAALHQRVAVLARAELDRVQGSEPFALQVSRVVERLLRLRHTAPSAVEAATALHISVRTMARRLAGEGTSHREIVDHQRAALARSFLDEGVTVAETARRLGYANASAFHRAYQRWYEGASPRRTR
jgi:AraC-like DNA-binding protein